MKGLKSLIITAALAASGIASTTATVLAVEAPTASAAPDENAAIRPFTAHFSDAQLADLKKRVSATRWPDPETVSDRSQGAQIAKLQALVNYWGTGYD
ncbi:epocide hydrolase domain-containing protein [Caballeronia ptereochthonis]|uniref:Epocide hydrolase domain-containing protein n=1 Tax=Caballeronia ptereochthonis TaxID=1777144 RepID=A0A158A0Y8_9BURK|nr:epocide hydrolase domain-containing protein [Caballeronia ptereochthonis]